MVMTVIGNSSMSWDWRREEGDFAGILPRNSSLDVDEYEADGRGTSGNKRSVTTDEDELWIREEDAREDTCYGKYKIVFRRGKKPFFRYWRENMRKKRRRKDRRKV